MNAELANLMIHVNVTEWQLNQGLYLSDAAIEELRGRILDMIARLGPEVECNFITATKLP